jgi:hypothetical protein
MKNFIQMTYIECSTLPQLIIFHSMTYETFDYIDHIVGYKTTILHTYII